MAQIKDELAHWELRIADLARRVEEQKGRLGCEGGDVLGSFEVLHLMENTLENWRDYKHVLQNRSSPN